jgi:UTP--glucose-1-phosphate uridylyltransferase
MGDDDALLRAAAEKMRTAGQSEAAIAAFSSALARLRRGDAKLISSDEPEPAFGVPALEQLPDADADAAEGLAQVAVVKLNGGLATSMGLTRPKSLIVARGGRSFLDVIAEQTLSLRRRFGVRLPLVLMNSDVTRAETLEALLAFPELAVDGLAPDFLQSMVPKLDADTLEPISWPAAPELEWCPPGHGDVYAALRGSGMLDGLRERGFRYAMISNADNLGAVADPRIAAHLARERIPFLMEVALGTEADRKGGHIARRRSDGRLLLRETAQTPPEDADSFRDYQRWRYYNTNNLWVDLEVFASALAESGGALELPVIVNRKTVDPRDPDTPAVVQLEAAMGAAIESFPGAQLLQVPRTRFVPVKTTDDLFVLRSDVYALTPEFAVVPLPERAGSLPVVDLDERYYKLLDSFEARLPSGPPSLRDAVRLVVRGDVTFGSGVVVRGDVSLDAASPMTLPAGAVLEG